MCDSLITSHPNKTSFLCFWETGCGLFYSFYSLLLIVITYFMLFFVFCFALFLSSPHSHSSRLHVRFRTKLTKSGFFHFKKPKYYYICVKSLLSVDPDGTEVLILSADPLMGENESWSDSGQVETLMLVT